MLSLSKHLYRFVERMRTNLTRCFGRLSMTFFRISQHVLVKWKRNLPGIRNLCGRRPKGGAGRPTLRAAGPGFNPGPAAA